MRLRACSLQDTEAMRRSIQDLGPRAAINWGNSASVSVLSDENTEINFRDLLAGPFVHLEHVGPRPPGFACPAGPGWAGSLEGAIVSGRGILARILQGFQIFNSATLLKSASLVARFVRPFRLITAR